MKDKELSKRISSSVFGILERRNIKQSDVADQIGITKSSMSYMMNGDTDFPLIRFLKFITVVHPSQEEIDEIFSMYLESAGISGNVLRLQCAFNPASMNQTREEFNLRTKAHGLIDKMSDEDLVNILPILERMVSVR